MLRTFFVPARIRACGGFLVAVVRSLSPARTAFVTDQPVHLEFGAPSTESIPPRTPGRVRLGVMGGTFDPIRTPGGS